MNKVWALFSLIIFLTSCQNKQAEQQLVSCDYLTGIDDLSNITCGEITVPENHEDPNSRSIKISYIIIAAQNSTDEYPMIFLSGGPGGASLTSGRINGWLQSPLRENRPIILLDQRGIGYSSPLPNMNEEMRAIFAKNANYKEEQVLTLAMMEEYAKMCEDREIQLKNYNTFQNALDVGVLMKELKFEKYNIYGVSYGTRLARVVQEIFPERLNSVILNSPNPMKGDFLIDRLNSYSLALSRVLAYCEENPECNSAYPTLKEDYLTAIKSLEENPLALEAKGQPFYLNAQDGIYFIRRQLYQTDSREKVPLLVKEYLNGGGPIIQGLVENAFGPGYNYGMWLSVERHEMYNPDNTDTVIDEVQENDDLLPYRLGLFTASYLSLEKLHTAQLGEDQKEFKVSDVPTIITVNQFDPVTPPENGRVMMETLSKGQLFVLDEGGHGGGDADCRNKVMDRFMSNPVSELDASCLNLYVGS